jgi:hypothetical protein
MGTYDEKTADDLRAEAKKRDLPVSGTKQEIAARLEADDKARSEKAGRHPMLAGDNTVDTDALLAFTGEVRDLADELVDRLHAEVVDKLQGMEQDINDPRSGVVLASARRLLGAVDDVKRDLKALHAVAAMLGQDAAA